ncbi:DUF1351 domain-containing protein [Lentilactobacillus parabuchneri]|uniref:DUF1351 domain-containing protein n=1 Tax=Lentilactobacillus parabuchneri TaxID=152331 RepID=UPI00230754AB|nr:DUF1351 domain-containing protein [Lentilactobacillus parabuchneri]MDB1104718.1 DUF1351 domain-containing protein [Lentilactobacillus parabuchneri]
MESDLQLPDYTIDYRPTVISINNFDQLKTAVEAYAAKYQNLAVSTSTEKEAKASRAELRKLKTALDDKRKEIKKKYAEPYEAFAKQIKDLEATLDASINPIDSGLKELEEHQRQTRLEHVQALINEMAPNYHVESNEVEIDPTWLNKSTSKKKVTEGIADVMGYIKKKHDDLETGINAITKYAQAYNIDPAGWIDQLKQGQDVNYLIQAIDNQFKRNQEAQQKAEAQAAAEKVNQVQKGDQTIDKTTGEVVSHSVVLKITTTIPEMNLLKAYMDNKGIQYERVGG